MKRPVMLQAWFWRKWWLWYVIWLGITAYLVGRGLHWW